MKPRPAVALALVGWYLMVPVPQSTFGTQQGKIKPDLPLSQWAIGRSFEKAADCEAFREQALLQSWRDESSIHWLPELTLKTRALAHGVCISTLDPRLAK